MIMIFLLSPARTYFVRDLPDVWSVRTRRAADGGEFGAVGPAIDGLWGMSL